MKTRILSNQIRCLKCGDTPFSAYRHDFKYCECRAVAVDGGMAYLKRSGDPTHYEDLSIMVTEKLFDAMMEQADWCRDNKRNSLGYVCAIARAIRDAGYDITSDDNGVYKYDGKAFVRQEEQEKSEATLLTSYQAIKTRLYAYEYYQVVGCKDGYSQEVSAVMHSDVLIEDSNLEIIRRKDLDKVYYTEVE